MSIAYPPSSSRWILSAFRQERIDSLVTQMPSQKKSRASRGSFVVAGGLSGLISQASSFRRDRLVRLCTRRDPACRLEG